MRNKLLGRITFFIAIMIPVVANSYEYDDRDYASKKFKLIEELYDNHSEDSFYSEIYHHAGSDLREALYKYEKYQSSTGLSDCKEAGVYALMRFAGNESVEYEGDVLNFNLLDNETVRVSLFGYSVEPKAYKDFIVNCSNKGQCVIADIVTGSEKESLIEDIEESCTESALRQHENEELFG